MTSVVGAPRLGILGAGRSRNGLGPFLASACERYGAEIVAVLGRDAPRTAANAAELGQRLGHPVEPAADLAALSRMGLAGLVVAAPEQHHLGALETALAAGLACLCEKPLVAPAEIEAGLAVARAFAERGLLLVENCQWPFVVPVVSALHGPLPAVPQRIALGLSPIGRGAMVMLRDALPHLLSVVQAVVPAPTELHLVTAALDERGPLAERCCLLLDFRHPGGHIEAELQLRHCQHQPRPAWLALDGRRIDRRIGPDYRIAFAAGEQQIAVADPLHQLVAAFVQDLRGGSTMTARRSASGVAARLRLYGEVLTAVGG